MVDAIVSTGANIVDQDFFEALGFRHYVAEERLKSGLFDDELRQQNIDRIYDTLIDEDQLRICDETVTQVANQLEPRPYSSREFIGEMGRWLTQNGHERAESIVLEAFRRDVPIFVPAFSDCSAGFGLIAHQAAREEGPSVSIDSVRDFHELSKLKIHSGDTGLLMIGGGVPKNFAQDIVVAADILGHEASDAQICHPGDGGGRAGRGAVRFDAQGSLQLGQSRYGSRANGLQRSDFGRALDRRLCVPQGRLEKPPAQALEPSSLRHQRLIAATIQFHEKRREFRNGIWKRLAFRDKLKGAFSRNAGLSFPNCPR